MKEPTYEWDDAKSFLKFMQGISTGLRRKEITVEETQAHSQMADKVIKHNLTCIMYEKMKGLNRDIDFFEPKEKQVMIG